MIFIWWHLIFQLTSKYMLNFFDKKNHDHITRVIKVIALLFQRRRVRHLSNETFGKVHLWPNLSTGKICHAVQKKSILPTNHVSRKKYPSVFRKILSQVLNFHTEIRELELGQRVWIGGNSKRRMRNEDGVEDDSWDYKKFLLENDTNL